MTPLAIEALRPRLQSILQSLALQASPEQESVLLDYLALLQRWNATYNLTAVRDPDQMLIQHLADCLGVIEPLRRERGTGAFRLLDVGSGGGLPGAIIAVLNPSVEVTCVDTVGKKAAFVRQAAVELKLHNLHAEHARVENLRSLPFDVISSRAFASLSDFVRLSRSMLAPSGTWMAMKGKAPEVEIAALPGDIDVFHVEQLQVPQLDAERCIVWMKTKPPPATN